MIICNMQLDHIDPENKKDNVSALKYTKEKILLE